MKRRQIIPAAALSQLVLIGSTCHAIAGEAHIAPQAYKRDAGSFAVEAVNYDWRDKTRDRDVPVKIYYPKTGDGPFPVIIFSHGLGGTRDGYEYLGRHWASHGFVSVHVQHLGSDDAVWQGQQKPMSKMQTAAGDIQNSINRPLDIRFAIDQVTLMNKGDTPLRGRLDLEHIGCAGHSFGAYTTLAIAGEVFGGLRRDMTLSDPRVKAAIPMSSPVPKNKEQLDKAFGSIKIPCLHMTGTEDNSVVGNTKADERRLPFDHSKGADKYLVIFSDGDHMVFSGRGRQRPKKSDALFQDLIRQSTAAFWDAYLKGDAKAKSWLADGGFESILGRDGSFEKKLK